MGLPSGARTIVAPCLRASVAPRPDRRPTPHGAGYHLTGPPRGRAAHAGLGARRPLTPASSPSSCAADLVGLLGESADWDMLYLVESTERPAAIWERSTDASPAGCARRKTRRAHPRRAPHRQRWFEESQRCAPRRPGRRLADRRLRRAEQAPALAGLLPDEPAVHVASTVATSRRAMRLANTFSPPERRPLRRSSGDAACLDLCGERVSMSALPDSTATRVQTLSAGWMNLSRPCVVTGLPVDFGHTPTPPAPWRPPALRRGRLPLRVAPLGPLVRMSFGGLLASPRWPRRGAFLTSGGGGGAGNRWRYAVRARRAAGMPDTREARPPGDGPPAWCGWFSRRRGTARSPGPWRRILLEDLADGQLGPWRSPARAGRSA